MMRIGSDHKSVKDEEEGREKGGGGRDGRRDRGGQEGEMRMRRG